MHNNLIMNKIGRKVFFCFFPKLKNQGVEYARRSGNKADAMAWKVRYTAVRKNVITHHLNTTLR